MIAVSLSTNTIFQKSVLMHWHYFDAFSGFSRSSRMSQKNFGGNCTEKTVFILLMFIFLLWGGVKKSLKRYESLQCTRTHLTIAPSATDLLFEHRHWNQVQNLSVYFSDSAMSCVPFNLLFHKMLDRLILYNIILIILIMCVGFTTRVM